LAEAGRRTRRSLGEGGWKDKQEEGFSHPKPHHRPKSVEEWPLADNMAAEANVSGSGQTGMSVGWTA
jgi:hypothetical protein